MNESQITGWIASAMQFVVAGYALRLNRRFGTARVGWSLFGAFALMAVLQLVQSAASLDGRTDSGLKVNVTYVLISFLMLIGLVHMEAMLKERLRLEGVEHQLRADLELEVKSKTAHLTRAIEELVSEMDETKRMSAIIESAGNSMTAKKVDGLVAADPGPARQDGKEEHYLAGIMGREWIAHF
jgi:hypothetical protein